VLTEPEDRAQSRLNIDWLTPEGDTVLRRGVFAGKRAALLLGAAGGVASLGLGLMIWQVIGQSRLDMALPEHRGAPSASLQHMLDGKPLRLRTDAQLIDHLVPEPSKP
jgi:hypothetical protein